MPDPIFDDCLMPAIVRNKVLESCSLKIYNFDCIFAFVSINRVFRFKNLISFAKYILLLNY